MSMNPLNDIAAVYMQEVFKPQLGKGGDSSTEGGKKVEKGKDDAESSAKRIRQAVYDIRYRARREDVKLDQAFSQYMGHTTMNAQEKAAVKEKLGLTAGSGAAPVKEEMETKKYKVRVKDKESGKSYVRYATREKINQLRSNPNISSVEMTGYGDPYEGEKKKGKATAAVKSGKGLDPVGKEDKDIDNDGDHDKTDKYLLNRRKVRSAAIETRKENFEFEEAVHATAKQMHSPHEVPSKNLKGLVAKAVKRIDTDVDGDTDRNDKAKGELGEFIPGVGNKRLYSTTRTKTAKESFSNWREDLIEVLDSNEDQKQIKEKKIKNVIKINPELKESVESLGGFLVDVKELNCILEEISHEELHFLSDDLIEEIVEEVFYEFLDEGYDIDSIEDIICESLDTSYELLDEKVDLAARAAERKKYAAASEKSAKEARKRGADVVKKEKRAEKIQKVKDAVKKVGSSIKAGIKKAGKSAVTGASYAAGKAVGTAKKVGAAAKTGYEAGKKSTESGDSGSTRAPKTYRYVRPESKKRSGLASKVGSLLKKGLKKAVGKTARVVSKGADKVASKLGEEKDPCWKGYTMVGMKKKNGKEVPNCVPAKGVKKAKGFKEENELEEKALSKAQQRFMGMVYAAKKGETPASPEVAKAAAGISKKSARDFAKTKHSKLPEKKIAEAISQIPGKETTPPKGTTAKQDDIQRKQMLANKQKMIQKQQMLQRQQLQLQKQGKLPMGHATEEVEYIDELRRSEKEGKGSPEMRTKSGHLVGARGERKRKGEMGGRHFYSGGEGGARTERGKKKGEEGSQQQRMNPSAASKVQQIIKKKQSTMSSRFD